MSKLKYVLAALVLVLSGCGASQTAEEPVSSPPSSPAEVTPSAEPVSITLNVSGDLLWHDSYFSMAAQEAASRGEQGMDFYPFVESAANYVSAADWAICQNEVPYAEAGGPYSGYPMFQAPPDAAKAVAKAGWDMCTTVSNHTMDGGWAGLVRTKDVLEAQGVVPAGTHRTPEEAAEPLIVDIKGAKVGFISQTYGLNGIPKAEGKDWSVDILDADKAIADAKKAKEAGADIVVVHMHAGDEMNHQPNQQQLDFAERVTASPDVDFVYGQHAHVSQPITKVNGKWVVYGTGNVTGMMLMQNWPDVYEGYFAQITFEGVPGEKFEATKMEWAPLMISNRGYTQLIPDEIKKGAANAAELKQSAARTRAIVTSLSNEMVEYQGA